MSADADRVLLGVPDFDRELGLDDLLAGLDAPGLCTALGALLGAPVRLCAQPGTAEGRQRLALRVELEPVGWLEIDAAPDPRQAAAAELVQRLLKTSARYHMAADLHLQAVQADYVALQAEHQALAASEARYRALAGELEQRVAAQVASLETAQRQLYQGEKLAALGQLAAGVAHEINNPIGFIHSNLGTAAGYAARLRSFGALLQGDADAAALRRDWQAQDLGFVLEDLQLLLGESRQGSERITAIVRALKGMTGVDQAGLGPADLNQCVRDLCLVIAPRLPADARLEQRLGLLPPLVCDQAAVGQMLLSLLDNALRALGRDGCIEVATRAGAGNVELLVSDNGAGIAAADLAHVFEPFFTRRPVGQGAGLGLTVARDIAQAHGGRLALHSTPGGGTRVCVTLPLGAAAEPGT